MTERNTSHDRIMALTDGTKAPVVRIEEGNVTVGGEPFPLIIADEPIETRVDPMGSGVIVRMSFVTWGPVIADMRTERERSTVVEVRQAGNPEPLRTYPAPADAPSDAL